MQTHNVCHFNKSRELHRDAATATRVAMPNTHFLLILVFSNWSLCAAKALSKT